MARTCLLKMILMTHLTLKSKLQILHSIEIGHILMFADKTFDIADLTHGTAKYWLMFLNTECHIQSNPLWLSLLKYKFELIFYTFLHFPLMLDSRLTLLEKYKWKMLWKNSWWCKKRFFSWVKLVKNNRFCTIGINLWLWHKFWALKDRQDFPHSFQEHQSNNNFVVFYHSWMPHKLKKSYKHYAIKDFFLELATSPLEIVLICSYWHLR